MARKANPNRAAVVRVIFVMTVWVLYLLFALACVSYSPGDTASAYHNGVVAYHNWCGAFGARVAEAALTGVGPGIFVGIALLGLAMGLWSKGTPVTQLPLRVIGAALLVAVVSTLFNMCSSGSDSGGMLGVALGNLLFLYFKHGAWLIALATLIVGGLLVADEIVLSLPGRMKSISRHVPTEQLASAAAGAAKGAAGGMWGGFRSMLESLGRKNQAKRKKKDVAPTTAERRMEAGSLGGEAVETGVAVMEAPEVESVTKEVEEKEKEPVKVPAVKVEEGEILVRKPEAAKGPAMPFRPTPPAAQKQDLGNYRLPGLDLLDEPEPVDTQGQEQRVREKAKVLEATLTSFGIDGKVEAIDTGPVVTLYELGLAPGIKSSQVAALSKDIARALKSPPVRII
ncbi:MAG TPA: DNA translocase FtsK 4TM domain-containing protein, partial [Phycisphaerae bacterium]